MASLSSQHLISRDVDRPRLAEFAGRRLQGQCRRSGLVDDREEVEQ